MICQWYPKPAVYDRKGWHPMPYLDQGEFFSEYGSYKVNITLPAHYVVAATGVLQNTNELATYKQIGSDNNKTTFNKWYSNSSQSKTLSYAAENVHDFAWFADNDYIIEYDTLQLSPGQTIDVFAYHHSKGNEHWDKATDYIKSAVRHYSTWIGKYPYPVVAAVEGPKNDKSGGMEYPMVTMITKPDATELTLDALITHEVGHNWFYGILGSNEREYAWMDEGIDTYYQFRYEAEKYRSNSIFESVLPKEVKQNTEEQFTALLYTALTKIPMEMPIDTPSYVFLDKDYSLIEYIKTAVWMYVMELYLGRENIDKAIQLYFNTWMFRHPYPDDLKTAFEKSMGKKLDEYFSLLKQKGNL
jgi:aminopeptidase N